MHFSLSLSPPLWHRSFASVLPYPIVRGITHAIVQYQATCSFFLFFYPVLSFLPCSLCLSLPCSYSYFALAQQIPVVIVITKNTPPPSRWSVFALSLSLFCYRHHRRFFFSLWMFFDWMRGERVCLGRCAQLIIFCIYPKERRRIVRPDLHALF